MLGEDEIEASQLVAYLVGGFLIGGGVSWAGYHCYKLVNDLFFLRFSNSQIIHQNRVLKDLITELSTSVSSVKLLQAELTDAHEQLRADLETSKRELEELSMENKRLRSEGETLGEASDSSPSLSF